MKKVQINFIQFALFYAFILEDFNSTINYHLRF